MNYTDITQHLLAKTVFTLFSTRVKMSPYLATEGFIILFSTLPIIYNGHYWSGIFSGKTEKMAAGFDDFGVIFGIFS